MEDRNPIHTMTLAKDSDSGRRSKRFRPQTYCRSLYLRINSRRGYSVCTGIRVYTLELSCTVSQVTAKMASSFSTVNHMARWSATSQPKCNQHNPAVAWWSRYWLCKQVNKVGRLITTPHACATVISLDAVSFCCMVITSLQFIYTQLVYTALPWNLPFDREKRNIYYNKQKGSGKKQKNKTKKNISKTNIGHA